MVGVLFMAVPSSYERQWMWVSLATGGCMTTGLAGVYQTVDDAFKVRCRCARAALHPRLSPENFSLSAGGRRVLYLLHAAAYGGHLWTAWRLDHLSTIPVDIDDVKGISAYLAYGMAEIMGRQATNRRTAWRHRDRRVAARNMACLRRTTIWHVGGGEYDAAWRKRILVK